MPVSSTLPWSNIPHSGIFEPTQGRINVGAEGASAPVINVKIGFFSLKTTISLRPRTDRIYSKKCIYSDKQAINRPTHLPKYLSGPDPTKVE